MAIFAKVAEAGSFRAAAKALDLSPSVVSHHISRLEEHLGTALLYRSTRRVSLTDNGAELFASAKAMVEAAEAGLDAIRVRSDQPAGRLRIAVAGAVFENPPYIDHLVGFAKRYPKVELSISFSDQKVELIGSSFDAAIRIGWLEDSRYKARKLCEIERAVVVAPGYLAGKPMPKALRDLEAWDWIKLAQIPVSRQLIDIRGEVPPFNPHVAAEVDSVAALSNLAISGIGLACVPRFLVRSELHDGRLIALSPDWELQPASVYAVWPNNVAADSLTMRFVHFLVESLSQAK